MCVNIPVLQDGVVENEMELFGANLTSDDPAVVLTRASVPVTIIDSDCKGDRECGFVLVFLSHWLLCVNMNMLWWYLR